MTVTDLTRPIEVLLIEDDPADSRLTREALRENCVMANLHAVADGLEALAWLRRQGKYREAPRPDIILLDLNMPKKDGRQTLAEIKCDGDLRPIPVVVFTNSSAEEDIHQAYGLSANCYVIKPASLEEFLQVVKSVLEFWFSVAQLPTE